MIEIDGSLGEGGGQILGSPVFPPPPGPAMM